MKRECGSCAACCYALGVHEVGKPTFVPCPNVVEGKAGRCGVYRARPKSCSEFSCLWLQGQLGEEHRPDRCGIVFATADLEEDFQILLAWVSREGADETPEGRSLLASIGLQVPVCVNYPGGSQRLVIDPEKQHLVPRIRRGLNVRAVVDENGELRRLPVVP